MKSTTIKVWAETRHKLRILAALQGKSMVLILERLVGEALRDVGYQEPQNLTRNEPRT